VGENLYRGNHTFGVTGLVSVCRGETIMDVFVIARSTEVNEGDVAISIRAIPAKAVQSTSPQRSHSQAAPQGYTG
jgi:hypothetical protein